MSLCLLGLVVLVMGVASCLLFLIRADRKGRKGGGIVDLCRRCSAKKAFVHLSTDEERETTKLNGTHPSMEENDEKEQGDRERLIPWRLEELKIDSHPLKRGRFSQIYRCEHQGQELVLKLLQETTPNKQIFSLFQHEKQIFALPHFHHDNLLKFVAIVW